MSNDQVNLLLVEASFVMTKIISAWRGKVSNDQGRLLLGEAKVSNDQVKLLLGEAR